jgi:flagellar basal body-associated protein FliL
MSLGIVEIILIPIIFLLLVGVVVYTAVRLANRRRH